MIEGIATRVALLASDLKLKYGRDRPTSDSGSSGIKKWRRCGAGNDFVSYTALTSSRIRDVDSDEGYKYDISEMSKSHRNGSWQAQVEEV
jgi:hypothetical protein